ncbi:hypothetical protein [Polaromonas sp.]|uniref:hypothetical protein n=1 Tax=Polaromonas sp. TaxID=1869339 RepID=UPI0017AB9FDC|nr:hypothetical protein [Polaromonas sp.]
MQLQVFDYGTSFGFLPIPMDREGYAMSQDVMDLAFIAIFFIALNTYSVWPKASKHQKITPKNGPGGLPVRQSIRAGRRARVHLALLESAVNRRPPAFCQPLKVLTW